MIRSLSILLETESITGPEDREHVFNIQYYKQSNDIYSDFSLAQNKNITFSDY